MTYTDVNQFFDKTVRKAKAPCFKLGRQRYIRLSAGFDIETTRIEKHAFMWCWQFGIGSDKLIGRTWQQYNELLALFDSYLSYRNCFIIVWIANLGHEHAFLGRRYHWDKIFAIDSHTPLFARSGCVEYRECLSISGQGGLANLAKNYCTTMKAVGDLDYRKIRNSKTPISDGSDGKENEQKYIENDVQILTEWMDYILKEYVDKGHKIPLTATSIPRNKLKEAVKATGKAKEIRQTIKAIYPDRVTYNFIMMYLFRGGYTHANIYNTMIVHDDVYGADFDSSYPASMEHELYPVSGFVSIDLECDGKIITDPRMQSRCIWFIADFYDIEKTTQHTVESEHKIMQYENARFDNGRLSCADHIRVALTEVDYQIYCMMYKWKKIKIVQAHSAAKGKLPRYVLDTLEYFYKKKYDLKKAGLSKTPEYANSKIGVNSNYGMMVQRLNFEEWTYNEDTGEWKPKPTKKTYKQMINGQVLYPYWGIYITAYSRLNIIQIIHMMDPTMDDNNVVYCDTDSVYFIDSPRCRHIIEAWNNMIIARNKMELPYYMQRLGALDPVDDDWIPYRFKTLGAKRYMKVYQIDGKTKIECTVAGMKKFSLQRKLLQPFKYADDCIRWQDPDKNKPFGYISESEIFDLFNDHMLLMLSESQKTTVVYTPDYYSETVTDEFGNTELMEEYSGAAIVDIPFMIKMDETYLNYILLVLEERRKIIYD